MIIVNIITKPIIIKVIQQPKHEEAAGVVMKLGYTPKMSNHLIKLEIFTTFPLG